MDFIPKKAGYLSKLESAILIKHQCEPLHKETVFVQEQTKDRETVWEGFVDAFDLIGHKEAKICYAWQHTGSEGNAKIFTVLGNNFITSAQKAVQAAIFADAQPIRRRESLESLKWQLEDCKEKIRKMGIMSEDLKAAIDSTRGTRENILQKRNPPK